MASDSIKSKESPLAAGGSFLRGRPKIRIGKQVIYLEEGTPGSTSQGEKKLFQKKEQLRKGLLQSLLLLRAKEHALTMEF